MKKIENIDDLIGKFLSGNADPDEAILLEDWKNANEDNLKYFNSTEKLFNLSHSVNKEAAWDKVEKSINAEAKVISLKSKKIFYLRVAASFIMLIGLGVLLSYFFTETNSKEISYKTSNHKKEFKLNDGTGILMNENSNLRLDMDYGVKNRLVHLNGNAKFNVVHNNDLPFTVKIKDFFIRDVGTVFNVRLSSDTDSIYVNVDEGVVLLFDSLGSVLEIKAMEKAIYIRSQKELHKVNVPSINASLLSFKNSGLAEVVAKLNETYATKIEFESENVKNCKITTTFTNEDLNTILTIITETLGLSFEKTKTGYLIKGQKCHS
jgi:transmembrane sensor